MKAKKGPMNIDLSKLGEASPMGYDDPATAKQPPIEPTISNAKAKQATTRAASRSNEFIKWWSKIIKQAYGGEQEPLLFFKYK